MHDWDINYEYTKTAATVKANEYFGPSGMLNLLSENKW